MTYEWGETKRRLNREKHGIDFTVLASFDWDSALIGEDARKDYQEPRYVAFGLAEGRLLSLVFTLRDHTIRVISIRKANSREVARYGKNSPSQR